MIIPTVEIRDRTRKRVAIADEYDQIELVMNLNAGGAWVMEMSATCDAAAHVVENTPGDGGTPGIVVSIDGLNIFNGPWLEVLTTESEKELTKRAAGTDDLGRLAGRWCEPSAGQAVDDHRDIAEETIRHFVAFNAILSDAPITRVIDGLRLGPYGALGSTVGRPCRYDPLLEVLQEYAAPDGLRFWIDQPLDDPDDALYFYVAYLRDQRALVQFSRDRGTLSSVTSGSQAPTANWVLAAGGGETDAQTVRQRGDSDSISRWGLWEKRVDQRQSNDQNVLDSKISEALAAAAGGFTFEVEPSDDDVLEYGRDYLLGDQVSVVIAGLRFDGVVVRVVMKGTPNAWTITPTIATAQTALSVAGARMTSLGNRIGQLERHTANTSVGEGKIWMRTDVIPTGWQVADGTFGTINTIGRAMVGVDAGNPIMNVVGELFGAASADLSLAIADHIHPIPNHDHTLEGTHTHTYDVDHGHVVDDGGVVTGFTGEPNNTSNRADGSNAVGSATHRHAYRVNDLDDPGRTTAPPTVGSTGIKTGLETGAGGAGSPETTISLYQPSVAVVFLQRVS